MGRQALKGLVLLPLALLALAGCSSDSPPQSTEQVKAFKGGPMPPEMAEKIRQAQQGGAAPSKTGS